MRRQRGRGCVCTVMGGAAHFPDVQLSGHAGSAAPSWRPSLLLHVPLWSCQPPLAWPGQPTLQTAGRPPRTSPQSHEPGLFHLLRVKQG